MPIIRRTVPSGKRALVIKGQVNGVTYWETVKAGGVTEARRREREIVDEILLKREMDQSPEMGEFIRDVFLPYSKQHSQSHYENEKTCDRIIEHFAGMRVNQIDPRRVREFQSARSETPTIYKRDRKPATVNREMSILSAIFTLAKTDGLIERNPCEAVRNLRPDPHRIEYLTKMEVDLLLRHCEGVRAHIRPIVIIGLNTGLRPGLSELFGLQRRQIDFDRNVIELTSHKTAKRTGKVRSIPMNRTVRELLDPIEPRHSSYFVFTNPDTGKPYLTIKHAFAKACEKAGISFEKRHPYVLRHTFGTNLAKAGVGIAEIRDLMGHTSVEMTMRYVHAIESRKQEAVEKLLV